VVPGGPRQPRGAIFTASASASNPGESASASVSSNVPRGFLGVSCVYLDFVDRWMDGWMDGWIDR